MEKGGKLGGNAWSLNKTWKGDDIRPWLADLIARVENHPRVTVLCERVLEILADPEVTDTNVRGKVTPRAGRGVGCVEAPRGTLIHDYSTDDNGLISRANIIVGTTHNVAPMNMSIRKVAQDVISHGVVTEEGLNKVEMAVRAYDP